jgi:urease gamma subunit
MNDPPWKSGRPALPPENSEKERLYAAIKHERQVAQRMKPSKEILRARAVAAACTQAVEAMRRGVTYNDLLEEIKHAMNEEICLQIHDS